MLNNFGQIRGHVWIQHGLQTPISPVCWTILINFFDVKSNKVANNNGHNPKLYAFPIIYKSHSQVA